MLHSEGYVTKGSLTDCVGKGGWGWGVWCIKKLDARTTKTSRKPKVVGVEFRAGVDLHRSEKPGWSAGDTNK